MNTKFTACPNCGANRDCAEFRCEHCGSYIFTSSEKYKDLSSIEIDLPQKRNDGRENYPGIYVFGRLLGKGERPLTLGLANYYTGSVSAGGKLLLTNKSLSFSAHAFNVGRQEAYIDLKQIENVRVVANFLISQHILVTANGEGHKFVVYHGNAWVNKIKDAINSYGEPSC